MFNKKFHGLWGQKKTFNEDKVIPQLEEVSPHLDVYLHQCYSLSPDALYQLSLGKDGRKGSTDIFIWYKAWWIVMHDPAPAKINVYKLKDELGVSWPHANKMKKKILKLFNDARANAIRHD